MYYVVISFLLIWGTLSCNSALAQIAQNADANSVMAVTLTQVREGALDTTLDAYGKVVPRKEVSVSTKLDGVYVLDVLVDEGDYVKKGQLLARLDKTTLQYSLDSLQAELSNAEKVFRRAQILRKTAAISQQEIEAKQSEYLKLKALVADADFHLKQADIIASTDGLVYQRNIVTGQIIQSNTPLFMIAAKGEIELEIAIPEEFVSRIALDTKVEANLINDPEKRSATIRLISPRIDDETRMAKVRLNFQSTSAIPINMFCTARFTLFAGEGAIITSTAIQQDKQGSYVWVVQEDNRVLRRNIKVLARHGNDALIEDVKKEEQIVARAGAFLLEGDYIRQIKEVNG